VVGIILAIAIPGTALTTHQCPNLLAFVPHLSPRCSGPEQGVGLVRTTHAHLTHRTPHTPYTQLTNRTALAKQE
jgi:hypothetical protein